MRSLLNAHAAAGGLTSEELMNLTVEEMPGTAANNKLREDALQGLICTADSPRLPPTQEKIVWEEKAGEGEVAGGISIEQLRPAFVYLVLKKKARMSQADVAKLFDVDRHAVGRAITRYQETGGFKDRPRSGRPRTATDAEHVERARELIQENPRTRRTRGGIVGRSIRSVARMLGIRRESSRKILKDELGFYAYKDVKRKKLTTMQRLQRILRGRNLRIRFANGRHRLIVFSDESLFLIEQHHNPQNDRTRAKKGNPPPKDKRTVEREMKPNGVMVWGAIGYGYKSELIFVEKSVRQNTRDYLRILRKFNRHAKAHFGFDEDGWQQAWTFQQDGAPSHKSNETQRWLLGHFPDVITRDQWPAASPDLNPIELVWGILKPRVNPEAHQTVGSLKEALQREWDALTPEEINACIDGKEEEVGEKKSGGGFMGRLRAMLAHGGGRFE
jgi:DDE superfamily endonuclease/Winged helix-turn helix